MNQFPGWLAAIGGVVLLYVVTSGLSCGSNTSTSERPPLPPDAEEPAVRAFIEKALTARIEGKAEVLKEMCQPQLAAQVASLAPRPLEFKIRRVEILSRQAQVEVWTRDSALDRRDNQSLVTYQLVRQGEGWRIASFRAASFLDDLTTQTLESK